MNGKPHIKAKSIAKHVLLITLCLLYLLPLYSLALASFARVATCFAMASR